MINKRLFDDDETPLEPIKEDAVVNDASLDFVKALTELASDEKWITTKNDHRVLLSEEGTVEAGFGGKFDGKKISQVGGKAKGKASTPKASAKPSLSQLKSKVAAKQAELASENKKTAAYFNKKIRDAKAAGDDDELADMKAFKRDHMKAQKALQASNAPTPAASSSGSKKATAQAVTKGETAVKPTVNVQDLGNRLSKLDRLAMEEKFASRNKADLDSGKIDNDTYLKRQYAMDTIMGRKRGDKPLHEMSFKDLKKLDDKERQKLLHNKTDAGWKRQGALLKAKEEARLAARTPEQVKEEEAQEKRIAGAAAARAKSDAEWIKNHPYVKPTPWKSRMVNGVNVRQNPETGDWEPYERQLSKQEENWKKEGRTQNPDGSWSKRK